jgi:hypothetical protein
MIKRKRRVKKNVRGKMEVSDKALEFCEVEMVRVHGREV